MPPPKWVQQGVTVLYAGLRRQPNG